MANPSPDEGVRAALEAAERQLVGLYRGTAPHANYEPNGNRFADTDKAVKLVRAALSTPVPEEGLPRGSASAAGGEPRVPLSHDRRAQAAVLGDLPESVAQEAGEFYENAGGGRKIKKREAMAEAWAGVLRPYLIGLRDWCHEQARPLSAEAGAGAAAALPSPPSFAREPVAYMYRNGVIWMVENCPSGIDFSPDGWSPLYTAEALAAERARAEHWRKTAEDQQSLRLRRQMEAAEAIAAARLAAEEMRERAAEDERDRLYALIRRETNMSPNPVTQMQTEAVRDFLQRHGAMFPGDRAIFQEVRAGLNEVAKEKAAAIPTIADPDGEARA